jgi:hypothetical protein
MRDLGTPVYGKHFFAEVLRAFPDRTRVLCVKLGDRPIAGAIVFRYRHMMEVPWASSLREFNPLCANVRLYWEMLQLAIDEVGAPRILLAAAVSGITKPFGVPGLFYRIAGPQAAAIDGPTS